MKRNILITAILAVLLSACGASTVPTVSPAQLEATAAVMASTMSAETQAAIPPTSTLTNTPVPSPTLTATPIPTIVVEVSSTASADPCDGPLFANPAGASDAGKIDNGANVLVVNTTKAPITVSLYLSKNDFGQCGSVSYVLSPNQSVSVVNELPYGCYYASAYINDPQRPSRASGGPACITGPDKTTFSVSANKIKITGP